MPAILANRSPNEPIDTPSTRSPGESVLTTAASRPPEPAVVIIATSEVVPKNGFMPVEDPLEHRRELGPAVVDHLAAAGHADATAAGPSGRGCVGWVRSGPRRPPGGIGSSVRGRPGRVAMVARVDAVAPPCHICRHMAQRRTTILADPDLLERVARFATGSGRRGPRSSRRPSRRTSRPTRRRRTCRSSPSGGAGTAGCRSTAARSPVARPGADRRPPARSIAPWRSCSTRSAVLAAADHGGPQP